MSKLTALQVAAAAKIAGFPDREIPTAVAVAKGESSYNTDLYNGICCYGLFQIHKRFHESKVVKYGGSWAAYKDPVVNAKVARDIWASEGGWCRGNNPPNCNPYQAWGVSNATGSWSSKMAEGQRAYAELVQQMQAGKTAQQVLGSASSGTVIGADFNLPNPLAPLQQALDVGSAILNAIRAPVEFANRIGRWISNPDNWVRVAEVAGGGLLLVLGIRIAFNKQFMSVVRGVSGAVLPSGRAGKAVEMTRKATS